MVDDPKAAGGEGEAKAEPVGEPSAEPKTETVDERVLRLEKEVEAHRKTQSEWQPQIEEFRRLKAQGEHMPSTTPAPADPVDQRIAALYQQRTEYPNDATVAFALDQAIAQKQQRDQAQVMAKERPKFDAMPEKIRTRAWQLWTGGYVLTPDIAQQVAEREQLGDVEKTRTELAKEREEIEKDKKARAEGRMSLGSRPILGPEKPVGEGLKRVTQSKWDHLEDLPLEERKAWHREYNKGNVEIVPG